MKKVTKSGECKHTWKPYTKWKGKCSKCGRASPWTLLLREAKEEIARAVGLLRALNPRARFGMNPTFNAIREASEYLNEVDRRRQR